MPVSEHLVFKGGTSLSKGWNLIERFSEDIDLAIDRKFLGFEGYLSNKQVKKLRKASCEFISNDFIKNIRQKIKELEIPDVTLTIQDFKDSDTDPLVVELIYKSLTDESPYLNPRVLIEVGARSLMEPSEKRGIQSLVGSHFADQNFADKLFLIPTILPKRTFLEKAFLLHEEFQKPITQIRIDRLSRHLYDLDKLMNTQHEKDALNDLELYKTIITHRQKFNTVRGIDYANHQPEKIDFVPPNGIIKQWKSDYVAMQENMIYGESESFENLIKNIEELKERFRKIGI
ncbi:MAG: hypothetical protein COB15_16110 [Flavobacteriales bacterium]|nr:MAG: hypothetical protein COB15_16110 [Flavobacteriales bacterium]